MPFLSDTASAIKSRFGFHDQSSDPAAPPPSIHATPNIFKSASKDSLFQSSAIRSISKWEDEDLVSSSSAISSNQSFEIDEDPSFWKDHNVQVVIRVRPISSTEISLQGYNKCVRQESCKTITWTGHPESRFTFDVVADEYVSQEKLFKVAGLPMVDNCMGGYNSCMFAYGQTGSGKTHTMLGDIEGGTRRHSVNCGMTPRVFEHLFSRIQKEKEARRDEKLRFTCKCSFLEIYNEQILDLLEPSSNNLQIREDNRKGVYVENLKEVEVANAREVIQQLIQGAANRKVAATNMNRASSRSHSVFTCIIESKWEAQGVTHHRFARLNLVDLAGSERQKSSGAEGERLKEATNINKSLSTLGLVIMNLVSISNGKTLHVPYRDSKLTFLLQDSLGGNSKTIIIANISPSSCCSLETLSTLKFAQRAKFIKNNAIVNEDASGDVIAMRLQIQQLKKEVSHLRGLLGGRAESQDNDSLAISFPASPGSFKWEGFQGSFSPLTSSKKTSQKKDYEVALVGAFRREKDKDAALQGLAGERQAALLLAKQREDEIQGLKMRLRFREAGIKRLEAVVSGKISAETHLLKEKEEHLKEIEVLRTQVDRNQEVTRFAMENLRLKEEIRRLKSFYEEGEREMMIEQVKVLQNKLLEALDWKLMHESDHMVAQRTNSDMLLEDVDGNNLALISTKVQTSINEENEFLRIQAIQNQSELETLRNELELWLQEKDLLERKVNDLEAKLEEKSSGAVDGDTQTGHTGLTAELTASNISDQLELKTMVDAIAAASQREAEAHETAIKLSKENEELRMKLKMLLEDNGRLIDLYEQVTVERSNRNVDKATTDDHHVGSGTVEKDIEMEKVVVNLEHQLSDMSEENERLMTLYEQAMQERDELKRVLSAGGENIMETERVVDCPEKLVDVYEGDGDSPIADPGCQEIEDLGLSPIHNLVEVEIEPINLSEVKLSVNLNFIKQRLERADEQLSDAAKIITTLGSFEKVIAKVDQLSDEINEVENDIRLKCQECNCLQVIFSEVQQRRALAEKKISALLYSLSGFSSSLDNLDQRESDAKAHLHASISLVNQMKADLANLYACREDTSNAKRKTEQAEVELTQNITDLKSKLEEENRMWENEKVLFAIDNIEKADPVQKNWHATGKALELLKSQEKKSKLQVAIKLSQEKLGHVRNELKTLKKKSSKIDSEIEAAEMEMQKRLKDRDEKEEAHESIIQKKEMLLEFRENGQTEIENMILEYQQHVFESDLKDAEMKVLGEKLETESRRVQELQTSRAIATEEKTRLLDALSSLSHSQFASDKVEEEILTIRSSVLEAKSLLEE